MSKIMLQISDMHIGSNVSVMPPGVVSKSGNEISQNPLQEHLYERWQEMIDHVKSLGGVDAIVNASDTVDGQNFKQSGVPTWSPDIDLQCKVAADMLSEIPVKRKLYYCSYGSTYHTNQNLNSEDYINSLLQSLGYEVISDKDIAFKFGGCYFHLRHETTVGKSIWMYRATHIARELMIAGMNRKKLLDGMDDDGTAHFVVLRGHTHQFVGVHHHHSSGFVIPCWKGRDDFIKKFSSESPSIGYVIGFCDDGEYDWEAHVYGLKGGHLVKQHNADKSWKKEVV